MSKCCLYLFFSFLFSFDLFSVQRPFVVLRDRPESGMFSVMNDVFAALNFYEKGRISGLEVNFDCQGVCYDPNYGANWWNYYFAPIVLGEETKAQAQVLTCRLYEIPGNPRVHFWSSREDVYYLIHKYVHPLPHIVAKVEEFQKNNFQNYFVIGIHYRGTDGRSSSYEQFLNSVNQTISSLKVSNYKFFVATDEVPFIDFMLEKFPGRVCFQLNVYRAEKNGCALHLNPSFNHYRQGEEAVLDCLLLSKCNFLILSYSNLSLCAALFNPYVPFIEVYRKHNL